MNHQEAQVLSKIAPRFLAGNLPRLDDDDAAGPVGFGELLALEEAGLCVGVTGHVEFNLESREDEQGQHMAVLPTDSDWHLRLLFSGSQKVSFPVFKMSTVAVQIMRLGRFEPDLPHLQAFVDWFRPRASAGITSADMVRLRQHPEGGGWRIVEQRPF